MTGGISNLGSGDYSEAITSEKLALIDFDQQQIDTIMQTVPGGAQNVQDIYHLSPSQEGLLFHYLLSGQRDVYVRSTLLEFQPPVQINALVDALRKVMDRHQVLRCAVIWERLPRPIQVVYRRTELPVEQLTLDPDRDTVEQLKERMRSGYQRMKLEQAPLLRLQVAPDHTAGTRYAVLQFHHVILDYQSMNIALEEAIAFLHGREQELPYPAAYRDYVTWALMHAQTQDAEGFFRRKLRDVEAPTAPFCVFDVHGDGSQVQEVRQVIGAALAQRLRVQANCFGVSAARLWHAVWALVVARTSGRDDAVYGTVLLAAQRKNALARRTLGLFVNTLPLRLRLHDISARELVDQTQRELGELINYDQAPLALAQRCSGNAAGAPLFTSVLNYRHSTGDHGRDESISAGFRVLAITEASNYPVTLSVDDFGEEFGLTVRADSRIDAHRTAEYVRTAVQSLVEALENAPETPALALAILPDSERRQVVHSFNETRVPYPKNRLVHELFEEQVERTPTVAAVVCEEHSLTYAELNAKANQLASYLRDRGVKPDQLVVICVERSIEMVVGMLGIWKAGGGYVPLDPSYPTERLRCVLEDSGSRIVLTQKKLKMLLADAGADVIAIDEHWTAIAQQPTSNVNARTEGLCSHNLAYVIYTSGSTGQPKGVMVEHRNVLSLWQGLEHIYGHSAPCHRIAVNASFSFDASVKQFIQLLSGRTICPVPQAARWDASMLLSFITKYGIEGIDCTPSQLRHWLAAGLLDDRGCSLRLALVGGEPIDAALWSQLARCAHIDFYNVYGPTESTVDTTFARVADDTTTPHIGRLMENRRIYVLDQHCRPVPIGVVGEMHIGGAGVTRGYLNQPYLTAERFLSDPFSAAPQARMYKTGDLGRWRSDGTIEYMGRNDHQVKVRGFRIELGEIEQQLRRHEQVSEAVVITRDDVLGDTSLVAYVTLCGNRSANLEDLRAFLRANLPEYMVPSALVILESLPLTPNGKLDTRALPTPECGGASVELEVAAPRGAIEEMVAGIWQELLRVGRIGRDDNFFDVGGHSLLAIRVIAHIRDVLDIELPLRVIFENPTVQALSSRILQEIAAEVSTEEL